MICPSASASGADLEFLDNILEGICDRVRDMWVYGLITGSCCFMGWLMLIYLTDVLRVWSGWSGIISMIIPAILRYTLLNQYWREMGGLTQELKQGREDVTENGVRKENP